MMRSRHALPLGSGCFEIRFRFLSFWAMRLVCRSTARAFSTEADKYRLAEECAATGGIERRRASVFAVRWTNRGGDRAHEALRHAPPSVPSG